MMTPKPLTPEGMMAAVEPMTIPMMIWYIRAWCLRKSQLTSLAKMKITSTTPRMSGSITPRLRFLMPFAIGW